MTRQYPSSLCCVVVSTMMILGSAGSPAAESPTTVPAETPQQHDQKMAWWRQARFGMFIHWGLYAVPAGTYHGKKIAGIGEWIMHKEKIPVSEYEAYAKDFNPVKFNADEWVRIARDAGMKYIVITAKHHDGFAMYGSKVTPYNIVDATPYHHDPMKDLQEATQKAGIKLCFYYSQATDWHERNGSGNDWEFPRERDFDKYLNEKSIPQMRELLTGYGPLGLIWFDVPNMMTRERADKARNLVHSLQPECIINDRAGPGGGDYKTPEQYIPATGMGADWETCMTVNDTWGYKSYDQNFKSSQTLIRNLIDIASKGGNYLLNVGPSAEGIIPQGEVDRLADMGKWMNTYGSAIYGTIASPFKRLPWGRCTQKLTGDSPDEARTLYLHVFDWPADGKLEVALKSTVTRAYLLNSPASDLTVTQKDDGLSIAVPERAPNAIASVIALEITGKPQTLPVPLLADKGGAFKLSAGDADLIGSGLGIDRFKSSGSREGRQAITHWAQDSQSVQWPITVATAGDYTVELTWACPPGSAGSEFSVSSGQHSITATVESTGSAETLKTAQIGILKLDAGNTTIAVKPLKTAGTGVMNLALVSLLPADATATGNADVRRATRP